MQKSIAVSFELRFNKYLDNTYWLQIGQMGPDWLATLLLKAIE